ncbi:PREDICTED: lysocardiolipin acyltransferase 1-like isoform X2 [Ceratosolen solmsi marchali]|nr:PREDICTED: lysocardiolipin acyltransferase 1-like isoform X2 [Ceratosolen solmsi marchali]XP_011501074.1 PREDICTED: lysocardiolipin acyltransferase 1-like isoform X2 [Ceratosolen solmsi marchali]XP_011501075.1 PREDICTED: lysocardiolipin acyltransferase 1-like isoform X2 [Ceratosolen solmsi marchali]XP_011501076.1 PREDICTED: lysocardiolipin acyltransferase 1-like isoform X2 [Ceratosolen solmsi marchali]
MQRTLRGLLYCSMWYASILSGFFIIACPLLPLLLISPPTFRKCGELLFSCWEMYPTVLMKFLGVKVIVSGDHILPNDSAILVMNHRTRVDWNFLWGAMYQACMPNVAAHKLKFILKDPIRHIPGPGWIMQMNGFLYITRRWQEDRGRLSRTLDYLVALHRRSQLLIFPEGTDLTPSSKRRSHEYADSHELPRYMYSLHPKTTGFSYLVHHLQDVGYLDAVYDLTVGYPDFVPQSELDLLGGKIPDEVHFHVERIAQEDMPRDELALRSWLEDRWRKKEQILQNFYINKTFKSKPWSTPRQTPLTIAFIFWTLLSGAMIVMLMVSPLFQLWTFLHTMLFIGISIFSNGFNQLEIRWYQIWKSLVHKIKLD